MDHSSESQFWTALYHNALAQTDRKKGRAKVELAKSATMVRLREIGPLPENLKEYRELRVALGDLQVFAAIFGPLEARSS